MPNTFDPTNDIGVVRMLVNDTASPWVFSDAEIQAFLDLEGGNVKLAAAQAIDTNADNEALSSKVISDQTISTDGAKVAEAMRKHAAALRAQVDVSDSGDLFEIVDLEPAFGPELVERWRAW